MERLAASRLLTRLVAAFSLVAAALHAGLVEDHLREWWGYGAFFITASLGQGLFGLVMFAMPMRPDWPRAAWAKLRRRLYWGGLLGNGAIVALYAVTRTVGIPFFGPQAGSIEGIGRIDVASKVSELLVMAGLGALLWRMRDAAADPVRSGRG